MFSYFARGFPNAIALSFGSGLIFRKSCKLKIIKNIKRESTQCSQSGKGGLKRAILYLKIVP